MELDEDEVVVGGVDVVVGGFVDVEVEVVVGGFVVVVVVPEGMHWL